MLGHHPLRITDIVPIDSPHDTSQVDIGNPDAVMHVAEGMDVIINCSVQRRDRQGAFHVNTLGTYNALKAAVAHKMDRFINTGPRFSLVNPRALDYGQTVPETVPPNSGTGLYALSKALGLEICRIFSQHYPIHILGMLFSRFVPPEPEPGINYGDNPHSVTFRDAAQAIKLALEIDLKILPSKFECFYITTDLPHQRFPNTRARQFLGFDPRDKLEAYWRKKT